MDMTQLTTNIWAVEVPLASFAPFINSKGRLQFHKASNFDSVELPPGTWRYLFTTKDATEEQARQVVDVFNAFGSGDLYKDYSKQYMWCNKAIISLGTLLRSKGCDPALNQAIIEKMPTHLL